MDGPVRRVLGDRYELVELLATGGMGRVWRGRDLRLGRPVAVKVLRGEYTDDAVSLDRFRAEAQLTARLVHRNIAALYDYGEVADGADGGLSAYLVMELVEGESLAALLAREPRPPVARVLDVLDQTAAALAAAHAAGVVHRDVKPGNVLLGADGVVKITDFGIAWAAGSLPLTRTGQVIGTAHYLAPEQAEGRHATPAGDVYALGMVAYECLAGRRAFDGESPVQIALRQIREMPEPLPPDVPENLRRLVERALAKDPAVRYPDAGRFRQALADVRAGRSVAPVTVPATMRIPLRSRPATRRGWATRLLVPVATLLTGAGLGVGVLQLAGDVGSALPPAAAGTVQSGVEVLAADFVGRPVEEVEAELAGRGLRVERAEQVRADSAPGLVTALGPAGRLVAGDLVTVTVTVAPAVPAPAPDAVGGATRTTALTAAAAAPSLPPRVRPAESPAVPPVEQPPAPAGTPTPAGTPAPAEEPTADPAAGDLPTGGAEPGDAGDAGDEGGGGAPDVTGDGEPGNDGRPDGQGQGEGGGRGNGGGNGAGRGTGRG